MLEAIHSLCIRHPGLRHKLESTREVIEGEIKINHEYEAEGLHIVDSFLIRIELPNNKSNTPVVQELGSRVPHKASWHVFPEGYLCLGSPLRLNLFWAQNDRNIDTFVEEFVEPYLFATSARINGYEGYVFGELAHGNKGISDDYRQLFEVNSHQQVLSCLLVLSSSTSRAARMACPCRCHRPIRNCSKGKQLLEYRKLIGKATAKSALKSMTRLNPSNKIASATNSK